MSEKKKESKNITFETQVKRYMDLYYDAVDKDQYAAARGILDSISKLYDFIAPDNNDTAKIEYEPLSPNEYENLNQKLEDEC